MFGNELGFATITQKQGSEEYNADVDKVVKKILDDSFIRVCNLINMKETEIRRLARYLYEHDYLDSEEMDKVIRGERLTANKELNPVRQLKEESYGVKKHECPHCVRKRSEDEL